MWMSLRGGFRGEEAVAGFVAGQVVDDEGNAVFDFCGVLAAGAADPVGRTGFGLDVAAPAVGSEGSVYMAPGDEDAAVGELLGVGAVEGEGAHLGRGPGAAAVGGEGTKEGMPEW